MSEPKKRQSQQSRIAALLREAILEGKLRPNERLIELELAELFKVSRTPIRAAIRELEETGWVRIEKNRGSVVVAVSPKEVADLFMVRANLEALAAGEASKKITPAEIASLESLLSQMEQSDPENDNIILRDLNHRFHQELCSFSGNSCLISLIDDLWIRSQFFRKSVWYPSNRWQKSIKEHREIVKCLKEQNQDRIKELLLQHINSSIGLQNELEQFTAGFDLRNIDKKR